MTWVCKNPTKTSTVLIIAKYYDYSTYFHRAEAHIFFRDAQCLKTTEKVAFNIASEASYVYNLSAQKFIKA